MINKTNMAIGIIIVLIIFNFMHFEEERGLNKRIINLEIELTKSNQQIKLIKHVLKLK